MTNAYAWIDKSLIALHRANRYRSPQAIEGMSGPEIQLQGARLVNFASNDYLGLASDPRLLTAASNAVKTYGTGSTGSRLLSGHRPLHRELEQAIATLKQTEDALVFSSGYLANVGTIAALVGQPDLVLADEYNHASLNHGALISQARVVNYRHGDGTDLYRQLQQHRPNHRRGLIVTDSVFSMDGDLCPLPAILAVATTSDTMVLVDEAHGTGVLGAGGAGVVEHYGCTGHALIQVGTLSKALGSLGGYVAGSTALIDFLRNRAPGWIYTTGLSPADTGAALAAVMIVQQEPARRQQLWNNVTYLNQQLDQLFDQSTGLVGPLHRLPSGSPIICLECGSAATILQISHQLHQHGVWVSAVRPPTVPTSRLRITVMATHQRHHLDRLIAALAEVVA